MAKQLLNVPLKDQSGEMPSHALDIVANVGNYSISIIL